jgi:hypothetical protein
MINEIIRWLEYHEKTKEKTNKERLEKITCECGAVIVKSGKSRHILTKKHIQTLQGIVE